MLLYVIFKRYRFSCSRKPTLYFGLEGGFWWVDCGISVQHDDRICGRGAGPGKHKV